MEACVPVYTEFSSKADFLAPASTMARICSLLARCPASKLAQSEAAQVSNRWSLSFYSRAHIFPLSPATSTLYACYARRGRPTPNKPRSQRSPACSHHLRSRGSWRAVSHVCSRARLARAVTHGPQPIRASNTSHCPDHRTLLSHSCAKPSCHSFP
jgi:hypothetical protein